MSTRFGPSKKSSRAAGTPGNLRVYVERLRQQAEDFQETLNEEARALLEEIRQAQRRDHGR